MTAPEIASDAMTGEQRAWHCPDCDLRWTTAASVVSSWHYCPAAASRSRSRLAATAWLEAATEASSLWWTDMANAPDSAFPARPPTPEEEAATRRRAGFHRQGV